MDNNKALAIVFGVLGGILLLVLGALGVAVIVSDDSAPAPTPVESVEPAPSETENIFDVTLNQVWNDLSYSEQNQLCALGPEFAANSVWKNLDPSSKALGSLAQMQVFFASVC